MTPLFLALLVAQAPLSTPPAPVTPPPPAAVDTTTPPPEGVAPGNEPVEVKLFAQFVERHLLAIGASGAGFEVRKRERVFRIQDDDFETAFSLVPDAFAAAKVAHDDFLTSSRLQMIGLALAGGALAATLVATLVRSIVLPLLIIGLVGSLVGLVLTLVALPFAVSAQTKFFSSIATYNKGLLELRPPLPSLPLGGGITLALPESRRRAPQLAETASLHGE